MITHVAFAYTRRALRPAQCERLELTVRTERDPLVVRVRRLVRLGRVWLVRAVRACAASA